MHLIRAHCLDDFFCFEIRGVFSRRFTFEKATIKMTIFFTAKRSTVRAKFYGALETNGGLKDPGGLEGRRTG